MRRSQENALWRTFALDVLVALHEAELLDVSDKEALPFLERVSVVVSSNQETMSDVHRETE